MNQTSKSVKFTLWANRSLMLIVVILVFAMPTLLRWYNTVRILAPEENIALVTAFYCCVPVILFALWHLDKLLRNISKA